MTCAHNYEVVTKKAALESSLQKILVADSSKFGQVRPGYFAELEEIDEIDLARLRGNCVEEVKRINGMLSFDDAVEWQRG